MKLKTIASLLAMTLLLAFVSTSLPLTAIVHAQEKTVLKWLTHWDSVKEQSYWADVINYYETSVDTSVDIVFEGVAFDYLYDQITLRYSTPDPGDDPDLIHMHAMWIPSFANWKTKLLSVPPDWVQEKVKAKFSTAAVDGVSYKGIVWGIPTEYNTWALIYNRARIEQAIAGEAPYTSAHPELTDILAKMEARDPYQPITWDELKTAARALTVWAGDTAIPTVTGFMPMGVGWSEEERFQFMTLLWSNGGDYLDLSAPKTLFNETEGVEVMELYHDLGFSTTEQRSYNPGYLPDFEWTAWEEQSIALMVAPTWLQYVREAMLENFYNMGVTVIPTPTGLDEPVKRSLAYGWAVTVTQTCENQGRADKAWAFLDWLNEPRPAGFLKAQPEGPMRWEFGAVPKGDGCSIFGNYLITDSIIPSQMCDQATGRVTVTGFESGLPGTNGSALMDDFWFNGFITIANIYGRPDKTFTKSEEVQAEIGLMMDQVCYAGKDPATAITDTKTAVLALLPMAGDINLDGIVYITDAVNLITDWGANVIWTKLDDTWEVTISAKWNRGRSDIKEDSTINILDAIILSTNYGRTGDP